MALAMETRPAAYAVIIEQGKLLMTRWVPEDRALSPSGPCPAAAWNPANRPTKPRCETLEETGYSVAIEDILGVHAGHFPVRSTQKDPQALPFCALRVVFRAHIVTGELRHEINGSSDTARWVPIAELDTIRYGTLIDEVASMMGYSNAASWARE